MSWFGCQDTSTGCHAGAQAALAVHLQASDQLLAGTGRFQGWIWHRGATRVAWRRRQDIVVYKIETTAGHHANENEHRYAAILRERDKPWAPDTALYAVDHAPGGFVLAMAYYPIEVMSRDEVPVDALHVVPDQLLTNFRRTAPLPDGQVKVIDLGDVIPGLH